MGSGAGRPRLAALHPAESSAPPPLRQRRRHGRQGPAWGPTRTEVTAVPGCYSVAA